MSAFGVMPQCLDDNLSTFTIPLQVLLQQLTISKTREWSSELYTMIVQVSL